MLDESNEITVTTAAEIDSTGASRAAATSHLRKLAKRVIALTQPAVSELPLKNLVQVKSVFQFRTPIEYHSDSHIRELMKTPVDNRTLQAVTVWWCAGEWLVVDGHHRLDAYREANWNEDRSVPVRALKGSLDDALLEAARANMLARLQMDKSERLTGAWRLMLQGDFKGVKLIEVTGVSARTIANMKATARALLIKEPDCEISDLTWGQARWKLGNGEISDDEQSMRNDQIIQGMANMLGKHFGKLPYNKKPLLAQAIDRFDQQLAREVASTCSLETLRALVADKELDLIFGFGPP